MRGLKFLLLILVTTATVTILWQFALPHFKGSDAFLKITTPEIETSVFLNGEKVGKTPYLGEKMQVGDYNLKLEGTLPEPFNKQVSFSTSLTLTSQALTAVNYEFGPNEKFSSGDIRTFKDGDGLSVVTRPKGASVWLDGTSVGKSPTSLKSNKGVHKLKISADGFITRELEINVEAGFKLEVKVYLARNPFGQINKLEEGKLLVYDLSNNLESLFAESSFWAEGVFFFEENVKINFDVLIDANGKTYYKDKTALEAKIKNKKQIIVGYLGNKNDNMLTTKAQQTLNEFKQHVGVKKAAVKKQVQILATPTGVLNVREGPGISYDVVTKVKPGEKYELLEEKGNWYKIKLPSKSGWVSSEYAKKP